MAKISWRTDEDGVHVKVGNCPEILLGSGNISYQKPIPKFILKDAEPRLKSFDDLVKKYLNPYLIAQARQKDKAMRYRLLHKYQDSGWMSTNQLFGDLTEAICTASECSKDAIVYGMTAIVDLKQCHRHIVNFPAGGGKPCYIDSFYRTQILNALSRIMFDKINQTSHDPGTVISKGYYFIPTKWMEEGKKIFESEFFNPTDSGKCPDCKDGFYYTSDGSKEPCKTCPDPELDETCSKDCPDCNGTNYYLSHPQGTPGPCLRCDREYSATPEFTEERIRTNLLKVWNQLDWGGTINKVGALEGNYIRTKIVACLEIPANTESRIIIDKLVNKILRVSIQTQSKTFCEVYTPDFKIKIHEDGSRTIKATLEIYLK